MEIKLKKDRMTRTERWLALLNRQPMDRIPVYAFAMGFSTVNAGYTIADVYNDPQKNFDGVKRTSDKFGFQDIPWLGYAAMGAWEFGGEIKWPSGEFDQAPMVTRYPVITEDDGWKLELPSVKTAGILPLEMANSKLVEKSDEAFIFPTFSPFSFAAGTCGVEKFCRWMIKKPDLPHRLIRLINDFNLEKARYWVDTFGPERLLPFTFDTVAANQIISAKQFEQFALPYQKELHEMLLGMGIKHLIIHICGEQNDNLPYWAQIPFGDPGILSFGHEVDLAKLVNYFPQHIIMGNVEPAVIQTGTPEQVYELTRICIEKGRKHPGGFMLGPGCEMPPGAPEENIWAMMQAVNDFGWYD